MKKNKAFDAGELSSFCMELALLLHAAYPLADGLHLLYEETKHPVLEQLRTAADEGRQLSEGLTETGAFPTYLCHMVETGERTGRLEQSLRALSQYYENKRQLSRRIRAAILYPAVLLGLMLVVIAVLLTKVLPVFHDVFRQLGGRMTGLAGGLLRFGQSLDTALPFLGLALVLILLFATAVYCLPNLRAKLFGFWQRSFGDRGISRKVAAARFSDALSMGLLSGLPLEEAVRHASALQRENPARSRRMDACLTRLETGAPLAEALQEAELLPATYCRMLSLGLRSGAGDTVMEEIARRMEDEADEAIENLVSRVEPSMVLITSVLVGVILLSVMLPLMNIMSSIG